ncbi:MAG: oligosaccharide flippase family protein [Flavobacterium nitrogenifigens]|uniref:Polysaccharide transporter, PST family n=1 Tax=Flavobacterium nitrogenifigens TaxID=1617283 RepID=A0A521DIY3_9FLAO|nr:oligosaccharide flippase family protein [Flavobacterium nitrogenifigens]KAF2330062.1 oligosaccharide flippase family protein [Flavobacterium nitrogenifigens]MDQ8012240.1 oligosaccharide flippase family protein [Flavobacterium nitrogenifigens]SMO71689.1 polysaccharide transporter, PST family [Flavobacterium nitrogenifigens]
MKIEIREKILNYKVVLQNFSYLTILQLFNILLPLISYPYLIRVLGIQTYGIIVFAQSIIMYFSLIINFGFNISATKNIAENRYDYKKLNEIVSAVLIVKLLLWISTFIILLLLFIFVPPFKREYILFLFCFAITFNDFLFPQWFFQAIEKMKYTTFITIASKILFTILIFLFVHKKDDYLYVPIFQGLGAVFSGLIAIYILLIKEKIVLTFQKKEILKYYFIESLPLFISAASIQIYVNANRILVGGFLGMGDVAIYDLGEKILRLIKIPIGMFGQATFPLLAREKSVSKINKMMKFTVLFTLIIIVSIFISVDSIIKFLGNKEMQSASLIIRILSFSALMTAFSQFLGPSRLIIFGYNKDFARVIVSSGVLFCLGVFILILLHSVFLTTLAYLILIVEFWGMIFLFYISYKKKILVYYN